MKEILPAHALSLKTRLHLTQKPLAPHSYRVLEQERCELLSRQEVRHLLPQLGVAHTLRQTLLYPKGLLMAMEVAYFGLLALAIFSLCFVRRRE